MRTPLPPNFHTQINEVTGSTHYHSKDQQQIAWIRFTSETETVPNKHRARVGVLFPVYNNFDTFDEAHNWVVAMLILGDE